MEKLFSNLRILIAYLDAEFNFIRVNDAYAQAGGHDPEYFIGKNHFDLYPYQENERIFRQVVKSGEPYTVYAKPFEYPDQPERGVTYWDWTLQPLKDMKGKVEGLILSLLDVTARERALKDYMRLVAAIENAKEGIFIADNQNIIRYVNPAFLQSLGLRKAGLIVKKTERILVNHYNKKIYNNILRSLTEGITWSGQYRKKKKKNIFTDFAITTYPVKDSKGNITGYAVIERDITEELKLQKQIQQKYKMEALGTLAGGVAHDFNNILMPIIVNTEMALWNMLEESPVRDYLKLSLDAAKRGRELVHQIISFSRPTSQKKEPIRISPVIRQALQLLKSTLPSNIKINQYIRSESGMVLANPSQIYQVLINLCSNAADAMGKRGGELGVRLEKVHLDNDGAEEKPDLKTNDYFKLTVSDTGCGMNEEIMDRMFDPFFSTKTKGNKTGMGLAVVHGIIKDNGGFINVQSEEGEGTVFEVFLPQVETSFKEVKKEKRQMQGGDERILLVDDDEAILQSLRRALEHLGYRVITKKNGNSALRAFTAQPKSFDLIITDQIMAGILGSDLSQKILSIRPDIPIILCTGYVDKINKKKARDIGIQEFVLKPVNVNEIAQTIRHVLDK